MTHPTTLMTNLRRIAANPDRTRDREILIAAADYIEQAHNAAQPLGRQLATILDAALPLLQAEAHREARREADRSMREISWKLRHEAAVKAVVRAETLFGYQP